MPRPGIEPGQCLRRSSTASSSKIRRVGGGARRFSHGPRFDATRSSSRCNEMYSEFRIDGRLNRAVHYTVTRVYNNGETATAGFLSGHSYTYTSYRNSSSSIRACVSKTGRCTMRKIRDCPLVVPLEILAGQYRLDMCAPHRIILRRYRGYLRYGRTRTRCRDMRSRGERERETAQINCRG